MDFFVKTLTSLSMSIGTEVVGLDINKYSKILDNEVTSIAIEIEEYLPKVSLVNSDCDVDQYNDARTKAFVYQIRQMSESTAKIKKRRKSFSEISTISGFQARQEEDKYQRFAKLKRQLCIESEIEKLKTAKPFFYHLEDLNFDNYHALLEQNDYLGNPVFILAPTIEEKDSNFLRNLFSLNIDRREQFIYIARTTPESGQLSHWISIFQSNSKVLYFDPLGRPFSSDEKKNIPFLVFTKFVEPNEAFNNYECYLEIEGSQSQYNSNCCEMISIRTVCDIVRAYFFNVSRNITNGILDVFDIDISKKESKLREIIRYYYTDLPFAYFDIKKDHIDSKLANYPGSFTNRIAIIDALLVETKQCPSLFYSANENETFNILAIESLELSKQLLVTVNIDLNNEHDLVAHNRILDEIFEDRINIFLRAIKMIQERGNTINRAQISKSINDLFEKPSVVSIGRGTLILQPQEVVEIYRNNVKETIALLNVLPWSNTVNYNKLYKNLLELFIVSTKNAMKSKLDSFGGVFKDTELRSLYNKKMLYAYKKVNFNMQGIASLEPVKIDLLRFTFTSEIEGMKHLMDRHRKSILKDLT